MADPNISSIAEANHQFQTAQDLKSKGDLESALTWFRRAAITDPQFAGAHMEIGRLCKDKARLDSMFTRYALEAFRKAVRLDLTNQEAHDQYQILAQQMGILHELHDEYEAWAKQNPGNEVVQRAQKNLIAISMAIFSPRVQVTGARASSTIKKVIFITSLGILILGASLIFVPPLLGQQGRLSPKQIKSFSLAGIFIGLVGIGGFIFYRQID